MKKITTILIALCAITTQSFGQDETSSGSVRLGLKGGLNLSNIFDEQGDKFIADDKLGLVGGAFLKIPLGDHLGFQPEFMFAQKGFSATGNYGLLGTYSFTRTTYFFEIPLLIEVKANKYFSLLIGPQYCYLLKTKDVYSRQDGTITQIEEEEISNDNFRKNILAIAVGFDVNIDHITLSGRAGWDLMRNNGDGTTSTPRYKNNWLQATVGYVFY